MAQAQQKVVIVGAGFAGITAARTFLEEGGNRVSATVLEASNRVGGRAHSVKVCMRLVAVHTPMGALFATMKLCLKPYCKHLQSTAGNPMQLL